MSNRNLIFIFGTPGSGKTTRKIPELQAKFNGAYTISIDAIKSDISKQREKWSFAEFTKAKDIAFFDILRSKIDHQEQTIIVEFPALGLNIFKLLCWVRYAEIIGFNVKAEFLSAKWKIARDRVKKRAKENGNKSESVQDWQNVAPKYWQHMILHLSLPITRFVMRGRN